MNKVEGINANRLPSNPDERRFVDVWNKTNEGNKTLKYLLDRTQSNLGNYVPTCEEEEVAITIIQWLGSPIGQDFIRDVMEKTDA